MNLAEILQWIQFSQKTGTVVFEKRGIIKKVYLEGGLVISASSNDPKEYLGQILICYGWITEGDLTQAFSEQKKSGQLLGKLLCENYGVSESQIHQALRVKIEETVYDIFLWEDGKFIFTDGLGNLQAHDRLDSPIPIEHLIMEGARRQDEWKEFRKHIPNDDVVFGIRDSGKKIEELGNDYFVKLLYKSIDGERSIRRILLETRVPEYRGGEAFAKLYFNEFIEPVSAIAQEDEEGGSQAPTKLKEAVDYFKNKKYALAYDAIDSFLLVSPSHGEGQTLYQLIQEEYLKSLYKKLDPDSIPELTIDLADLNEKVFSSKEGFIASRINGDWNVKNLVMISPLGELESLKILGKLVDEGMVELKAPAQKKEA